MFKFLGALFVLVMLAAGAGLVLKGQDVVSAFGDRLTDPQDPDDTGGEKVSKRKICASLGAAGRGQLVGVATPVKVTEVEGALSPYTCRWTTREGMASTTFVDIVVAPADAWALNIRDRMMLLGLEADEQSRLYAMVDGSDVTPTEACEFASELFEAQGAPDGSARTVTRTTGFGSTPALLAQSCVDGRYHAVLATSPSLRPGEGLQRRVAAALRKVERSL